MSSRVRAVVVLAALLAAPVWARGTFCWEPVPDAVEYRLYAGVSLVEPWACHARTDYMVCAGWLCCAVFDDAEGELVFYFITASLENGTSESDGGHGPKEPCP